MLVVYLITLIVGGALLALSLVLGGHGDADAHGGDADAHGGDAHAGSADGDHGSALDAFTGWFPITSLRFWTFFSAFFGLTGTILGAFMGTGAVPTALFAVGAGYASG